MTLVDAEIKLDLLQEYMDFYIEMICKVRDNNKYLIEKFDEWIDATDSETDISFCEKQKMFYMSGEKIRAWPMKSWDEAIKRNFDGDVVIPLFVKTYKTWRYTGIEHGVRWRIINDNVDLAYFRRNFFAARELKLFMQKHGIE